MSLLDTASLVVTPNGTKAGKLYSVVPSSGAGDLDVTRATTATRVNSSGLIESVASNVPRLDYTNGTCPTILVEPQRTNLWYYSEQFDNSEWLKTECTITANSVISPDGTQNADKITDTTANNEHRFRATDALFTITTATTFSIFAKAGEYSKFGIADLSNGYIVKFDLSAGTIISTGTDWSNAKIENFGNGWYRLSATKSTNATCGYAMLNDSGDFVFTGTGTKGVYIWGAQVEVGSYATSYIPTTSASVTRNADVISKTGISSLIGQTEGTILWDIYIENPNATDNENILNIDNGSFGNTIYILKSASSTITAEMYSGGSAQASFTKTSIVKGRYKCAFAYANNNTAFFVNGVQVGSTDTSCSVPATSRFQLGQGALGSSVGEIKATALWQTRLTNTQLAQLTTI
jgi:hypothetical protein